MEDEEAHFVVRLLTHYLDFFFGHQIKPFILLSVHAYFKYLALYQKIASVWFNFHNYLDNTFRFGNSLLFYFFLLICKKETLSVVIDRSILQYNSDLVL